MEKEQIAQHVAQVLTEEAEPETAADTALPPIEEKEAPETVDPTTSEEELHFPDTADLQPEVIEGEYVETLLIHEPLQKRNVPFMLVFSVLMALFGLSIGSMVYIVPFFNPTATITITADTRLFTTQANLTVSPTHVFAPKAITQTETIPTTGKGHQEACVARGAITFYNGLPEVQTIPAGTLVIASNGVQI